MKSPKLKWIPAKGHSDRRTECGRYSVQFDGMQDRHTNSAVWIAVFRDAPPGAWLRSDGKQHRTPTCGIDHPPDHDSVAAAKAACQAHADAAFAAVVGQHIGSPIIRSAGSGPKYRGVQCSCGWRTGTINTSDRRHVMGFHTDHVRDALREDPK